MVDISARFDFSLRWIFSYWKILFQLASALCALEHLWLPTRLLLWEQSKNLQFHNDFLKPRVCLVMPSILVHSDCYNKTPQTGWLIDNRHLLFMVLQAESQRPGCQHGLARTLTQIVDVMSCPHMAGRTWKLCGGLLYKGTNPIHEDAPTPNAMAYLPPKGHTYQNHHLWVRFQHMNLGWGNTDIQTIAALGS